MIFRRIWYGAWMDTDLRQQLWDQRYSAQDRAEPQACEVLRANLDALPRSGMALDLACGLGGNALALAHHGLATAAWDYSAAAIARVRAGAASAGLVIDAQVRDVVAQPPAPNSVDVLVVSYFLVRELFPVLSTALRPGGVLLYETFCGSGPGSPSNPNFRLRSNELLTLCAPLSISHYRETGLLPGLVVDTHVAQVVAVRNPIAG